MTFTPCFILKCPGRALGYLKVWMKAKELKPEQFHHKLLLFLPIMESFQKKKKSDLAGPSHSVL